MQETPPTVAKYLHSEGICLRRIPYSNTSQVASFLTRDEGRLSFIAKGVTRAPKRGVRTGFDLLGLYELVYTPRPPGMLQNLTDRSLREDFRDIRRSLRRILCGYYAAELGLNFTMEGDPCPHLYELTIEVLRRLATGQRLGATMLQMELGVLGQHGTLPDFGACAVCGRGLPGRGAVTFSPAEGGPVCSRCEEPDRGRTLPVRADFLNALQQVAGGGAVPDVPPQHIVSMSVVARFHIRYILGKELRMWKYLQRRKLSRSLERVRHHARSRGE